MYTIHYIPLHSVTFHYYPAYSTPILSPKTKPYLKLILVGVSTSQTRSDEVGSCRASQCLWRSSMQRSCSWLYSTCMKGALVDGRLPWERRLSKGAGDVVRCFSFFLGMSLVGEMMFLVGEIWWTDVFGAVPKMLGKFCSSNWWMASCSGYFRVLIRTLGLLS